MVPCPFIVWDVLAAVMATHPNPPLTRDQVTLMKRDNVVDRQACALDDLGIRPVSVEEAMPTCIDTVPS